MFNSGSHRVSVAFIAAIISLLANPVAAQHADPIDQAIDNIIKGSSPKEETPKETGDTSPKPPKEETLKGGIKYHKRKDKVEVFRRPDGTTQYRTPDNKVVTVKPSGDRVYQVPDQKPQYRPPAVDDLDNYRPHKTPVYVPNPDTGISTPKKPLAIWSPPDPAQDRREHAPFSELAQDPKLPSQLFKKADEDRLSYNAPTAETEEKLISRTRTLGGTSVFTYSSGAVLKMLPGGESITTFPGLPQAIFRDAAGKETTLTPDKDGGIRTKIGDTKVMIDPATGTTYFEYANGTREAVGPTGAWGASDGKGGREFRDSNGNLIQSQVKDADSGYTIKQDGSGIAFVYKDGKFVGIGTRDGFGYKYRDAKGEEIPIKELVDPKNFRWTVAGRTAGKVAWAQKPREEKYIPPDAPGGLFGVVKKVLQGLAANGDLRPINREAIEKLKQIEKAGEVKGADKLELDKALQLVDATLRKMDLEQALKVAKAQFAANKQALDKEKTRIDGEKVKLLLRETRAANRIKLAGDDDVLLQVQRNGLRQLKIVLDGQDGVLKRREKSATEDIEAAFKRIDYRNYNLCPNKEPWKKCGHAELKKMWINQQLEMLLGKARIAQIKKIVQDRQDLNNKYKELKEKDDALKDKEEMAKTRLKEANAEADALKKQRDQLTARERQFQKQVYQTKTEMDRVTKQINGLEEAIKKYTSPSA